ncbi:hypothetical protein EDC04DRAFT_3140090 [Pisolithus marmoratus]|nr:hypothetical protein EDC04DRAFT_3140090 [Pisolithus marmoratus]
MDELDEARAELGRLEGTERTLFKQLVDIRAAILTQKRKIEELIERRPPAINRLPVELLLRIMFQSLPHYDGHRLSTEFRGLANRRTNLSTVSRLWRDVILNTPKMWRDVVLDARLLTAASLETQLTRSGNVPLNIFITSGSYAHAQLWLDVLVSSAERWQCLHMDRRIPGTMVKILLHALGVMKFPSLKDVVIYDMYESIDYLRFLLPNQAPALENLKLENFSPTSEFAVATTLTTLDLTFGPHWNKTMNHTFIPAQSLTVLSLAGNTIGWKLLPDSIHLPLLEVLKLTVDDPQPVMRAIVSPKLMCFDYSDYYRDIPHENHGSFGTGSKFSHVQKVTLSFWCSVKNEDAFCREFRGVRHVCMPAQCIGTFFSSEDQLGDSESVPADHWKSLETLTIHHLRSSSTEKFDHLVGWLTRRLQLAGQG